MRFIKRVKKKILEWLLDEEVLKEIKIKYLNVKDLKVDPIWTNYVTFQALTSDPTLASGRVWYRDDEKLLKYSDGSSTFISHKFCFAWDGLYHQEYGTTYDTYSYRRGYVWVSLAYLGTLTFFFDEETTVDNQSHAFCLYDDYNFVTLAEHTSTTESAGIRFITMTFTPEDRDYRLQWMAKSDGSNYYYVYCASVSKASKVGNVYIIDVEEREEIVIENDRKKRIKILRPKVIGSYSTHGYNLDEYLVIVEPHDNVCLNYLRKFKLKPLSLNEARRKIFRR